MIALTHFTHLTQNQISVAGTILCLAAGAAKEWYDYEHRAQKHDASWGDFKADAIGCGTGVLGVRLMQSGLPGIGIKKKF